MGENLPEKIRRVALVIGNCGYDPNHFDILLTPRNDAVTLAAQFQNIGYEIFASEALFDQDLTQLRDTLRNFGRYVRNTQPETAVIYFAGHGIAIGGTNYLIPIDAEIDLVNSPTLYSIGLDALMDSLSGAEELGLVILDACRSNTGNRIKQNLGKEIGSGLARFEPSDNRVLAYSAKEGAVANDGVAGENSPYVKALLHHLRTPMLELGDFFGNVRDDVIEATGGKQSPYSSIDRGRKKLYLNTNRVAVSYFETIVYKRGVPQGIGHLDDGLVSKRYRTHKLEIEDGQVRRKSLINSVGELQDDEEGVAQSVFTYRADGVSLETVHKYNRQGNLVLTERYNEDATTLYFTNKSEKGGAGLERPVAQSAFSGAMGLGEGDLEQLKKKRTTIIGQYLTYDDSGFVIKRLYVSDLWGTPACDAMENYGEVYVLNHRGQKQSISYIGQDGRVKIQRNGIANHHFEYDETGKEIKEKFLDSSDSLIVGQDFWSFKTSQYDEHGNQIETAYFGINGEPVSNKDGYARVTAAYDEHGNRIENAFFGINGEPASQKDGYARLTSAYDERGNEIENAFFGINGEPVIIKDGYARLTSAYDEQGNAIDYAFFGINGEPVSQKDGIARSTISYDEMGHRTKVAHFGPDGNAINNKNGYAGFTDAYDERGNQIECAFFGINGEPVSDKDGYARCTHAYDERGNVIEAAYFGKNGEPVSHRDGYARFTHAYDERGNVIEVAYFGINGEPVSHKDGCARFTNAYDERGNEIEAAYFGINGEPVSHKDGYARYTAAYDERGNVIEAVFFGINGKPVSHKEGPARVTAAFDERGNVIEAAYFGIDGQPTLHKDGYARFTNAYDERGNEIETAYFGINGEPVSHKDGYARLTYAYDERDNQIETAFFGLNGEPVSHKDGPARFTNAYDERGNVIEASNFGVDDEPVCSKTGVARATFTYDERGHETSKNCFDENGQPTLHKDGYQRYLVTYAPDGTELSKIYYDLTGNEVERHTSPEEHNQIDTSSGVPHSDVKDAWWKLWRRKSKYMQNAPARQMSARK